MSDSTEKGQKRRSDQLTIDTCIVCNDELDESTTSITTETWNKLREQAEQWRGLDRFGSLYESVSWDKGPNGKFCHKFCRLRLGDQKRLEQALSRKQKNTCTLEATSSSYSLLAEPQPAKKLSRTISGPLHEKNLCIWCMKPQDKKHPGRDKWHIVEQWNAWYAFKAHTVNLEDDNMRDRILMVIDSTPDPFATEIRYHRSCWRKYVLPECNPTHDDDELHLQNVRLAEVKQMFFKHVRLVIFDHHEFRTVQSLLQDYKKLLKNFGFEPNTKSSSIKSMLEKEFQDKIGFHVRYQKNESALVYDTAGGGSYVEAAINSWGISDEQLLHTAAHRIKESLSQEPSMHWPPHISSLEKDEESNPLLLKFLTWLQDSRATAVDDASDDPATRVLASLLLSFVTSKRTPFKVNLSVLIHGLTRSREIIDLLKKFSLGISYADVLCLYDTWAQHDIEENKVCPEELAVGMPGTGIMDNDDFSDDTLTGENTSHRTNVMFIQPEDVAELEMDLNHNLSIADSRNVKRLCMEQHRINPYKTAKRGTPTARTEIDVTLPDTLKQKQRGVIHSLIRLTEDGDFVPVVSQRIAAFAGFQANVQGTVVKSKSYYFLTFPQPPNKSVVHEIMCRMVAAAEKKSMPFIQVVGDQPVYALIVQLKYENPDVFQVVLPFLGPFHIHGSFIHAMYKRFRGSGLSDILVAADVIAEGSVDQALRGKHYKRSMRCLRLMYEALCRRIIQKGLRDGISLPAQVKTQLATLRDPSSSTSEDMMETYSVLESDPDIVAFVDQVFDSIEKSESSMAKYWLSFMRMTEILMMNLHALRTQNWEEFKSSLRMMIPWLKIYDNDKYGRWLVEFWLDISSLPDEQARYMKDGLFSQSMTGKPYSCLPLDLWIEMTMNKGSKMKAGWLKILKNEKMLLTNTRTVNMVNRVRTALHSLANMTASKQDHTENSVGRIKLDEQAVQDIDDCIREFDCDPFHLENPKLRSLQSGALASDALVVDFESAHEDGERQAHNFFKDRMFSQKMSFHATIHRNSRHNFENPPIDPMNQQQKVTKTDAMENKAMASIISLAETGEKKFTLLQVMEFRITDECLAIFNINGTMKKVQKSKLIDKLNLKTIDNVQEGYIAIIDMGFLWHLATPSVEDREKADGTSFTWGDYATKMFTLALSRHHLARKIIFVNDPYNIPFTIKDSERQQRSASYTGGSRNIFMKTPDKFPSSKEFQNLFYNMSNKQRLQAFIQAEFSQLCQRFSNIEFIYSLQNSCWNLTSGLRIADFECEHIEADTIMLYVYAQIRRTDIHTMVVIDSEDTDVVVLAAYVAHAIDGVLAMKRKQSIIDCHSLCPNDIAAVLLALHVHSGSDTTAAFFGHGKKSVYDKGTCTEDARTLLACVGKTLPVTQEVLDSMRRFTIQYIYNDKVSKSLAEARAKKWKAMKRTSTQRIPPDKESHDLKVARVNYQVYILRHYDAPDAPPSPLNHGWHMYDGLCAPIRYTHPALPQSLCYAVEQQQGPLTSNDDTRNPDESSDDAESEEDF